MERSAVEKLHLPEELERILLMSNPGQCVLRIGNEYAPLTIWDNPLYRALFTTDPAEQRVKRQATRQQEQARQQQRQHATPHDEKPKEHRDETVPT
jgi:hypothetical protein